MDRPGTYSLTQKDGSPDLPIAAAGRFLCDVIDGLEGLTGLSLLARFSRIGGGTKVQVYVKTSFDQGQSWCDIACLTFTTASAAKVLNLSGRTSLTTAATPTDAALTDDTCLDGPMGDRLRCEVVVTGDYAAGSLLAVRAVCR